MRVMLNAHGNVHSIENSEHEIQNVCGTLANEVIFETLQLSTDFLHTQPIDFLQDD